MRTYFFILFICPLVLFAQNQQTPASNGATDCPTFGKKNVSSKASLFQYMRTHKPQRSQDMREQQSVYRSSALPNIQEAQEVRDAALKKQEKNNEKTLARAQRQRRNRPVISEEPLLTQAAANKSKHTTPEVDEIAPLAETKPAKEKPVKEVSADSDNTDEDVATVKEDGSSMEASADAAQRRDKKLKKTAFKSTMKNVFKRTNKPTSRKHVEKCPSF